VSRAVWHSVPAPERTFAGLLNTELSRLDTKYEHCLPNLRSASTLLLGSDYSGESPDSPYLVFSFLLTSLESWEEWEPKRLQVRNAHLSDSRRMSFKRLTNGQRRRALTPLLKAANDLDGLSFSVAMSKQCDSVFAASPPLDLSNPEFEAYRKWKPAVLDKAFLVLHIIGILLGGLAGPAQNVFWFTDEDSIAANDDRICELTRLFSWITSQYLEFDLGHVRCGTSRCDDGSRQIEDFLAIPDMIAGALAEQMLMRSRDKMEASRIFWMHRGDFSDKTQEITWWFSVARPQLKRLLCIVEPSIDPREHLLSWFQFQDSEDV
jgi:hypothetical protein